MTMTMNSGILFLTRSANVCKSYKRRGNDEYYVKCVYRTMTGIEKEEQFNDYTQRETVSGH